MAINKNSTGYTFAFAIVMVVVVGATLAFTALALKDRQNANAADKKMMDILSAIGVDATRANASETFEQYVAERIALDADGSVVTSQSGAINPTDKNDPFNIDVKKDYRAHVKTAAKAADGDQGVLRSAMKAAGLNFPLFRCEKDGESLYVVPVVGSGLWGPIWGYLALESDMKTIYGATFDHKTETPGLGAEIKEAFFQEKFKGKSIDMASEMLFDVVKGGAPTTAHSVDGITGGTITSKGVGEMIDRTLKVYVDYFETQNARAQR